MRNGELIEHMLETASTDDLKDWAMSYLLSMSRDALEHEHLVLHEDREAL